MDEVATNAYLDLQSGDKLITYRLQLVCITDETEPILPIERVYIDGMYRVGLDIPPGMYTIRSLGPGYIGSYSITSTASSGNRLVRMREEEASVYLIDGQYLTLDSAIVVLSDT